jgi:ABC-2 type transport system permease protein
MSALAGTGSLLRLALRRDRILLPAWIATFAFMATFSAAATTDLYPTAVSRIQAAASLNGTPALVALYGRVYGSSLGALSLIKMSGLGAAMLGVLAFMLVVRHTRAEEESGRLELVGSAAVGRSAALTAALVLSVGASVAIGALSAFGLIAAGLPPEGSVAFGLAWAAAGCAFAAVGALCAQLTTGGRAAIGLAAAFLGFTYVLRAVGDAAGRDRSTWVSWLSPIGWSQQVRAFAHERWSALLLLLAFAVVVSVGAYVLAERRDLGAGLLADRPGPAAAGGGLSGPFGLAWRLHRGTWLAWAIGTAFLAAIVGSIATDIGGFFDSPAARDFITKLGGTRVLTDAFLAMELAIVGSVVSVFGMQAAMRLRSEETAWRADVILSTATGRVRWAASHVALAVVGTAGILLLAGLATGIGYATQVGDPEEIGRILVGTAVQIPAACVLIGIVVAAFGLAPRSTTATWAFLIAFLLVGEFGPVLGVPQWAMDLSPFGHTPRIPGGEVSIAPLAWLTVVAGALIAAGFAGLRRRDLG